LTYEREEKTIDWPSTLDREALKKAHERESCAITVSKHPALRCSREAEGRVMSQGNQGNMLL